MPHPIMPAQNVVMRAPAPRCAHVKLSASAKTTIQTIAYDRSMRVSVAGRP